MECVRERDGGYQLIEDCIWEVLEIFEGVFF